MKRIYKTMTTICLVVSLVIIPCASVVAGYNSLKKEATTEAMIGDALVARPLGLVSIVLGAACFVVSLPFSAMGGNTEEAADKLVGAPVEFTFKRPLGEL